MWAGPSVSSLAGLLTQPRWDEARQGIALRLTPAGPAADTLAAAARAYLGTDRQLPIGLSADLCFRAEDRKVTEIVKVHSVDLVAFPARGGTIIQPAEQPATGGAMSDQTKPAPAGLPTDAPAQPIRSVQTEQMPFPTDWAAEAARLRLDLNTQRVESAINGAHLPAPMAAIVRAAGSPAPRTSARTTSTG